MSTKEPAGMGAYLPSIDDLLNALGRHQRWCEREACVVCDVWGDAVHLSYRQATVSTQASAAVDGARRRARYPEHIEWLRTWTDSNHAERTRRVAQAVLDELDGLRARVAALEAVGDELADDHVRLTREFHGADECVQVKAWRRAVRQSHAAEQADVIRDTGA